MPEQNKTPNWPNWLNLPAKTRTLIVGDVHGCLDELRALLASINFNVATDQLIMAGDLIAKGPASAETLSFIAAHQGVSVIGNHDARWLRWHHGVVHGGDTPDLSDFHQIEIRRLSDDNWSWFHAQPDGILLSDYNIAIVHAGLINGVPLAKQDVELMRTMRSILSNGKPFKSSTEGVPWASLWQGPEHVVFGHDARRGLQQYPLATGLDTGCVYGGKLSALLLPEKRIVSVPAARRYADFD